MYFHHTILINHYYQRFLSYLNKFNMWYNVSTNIYKGLQMKKAINLRIDESLLEELDVYAKELDRTRTYLIEKAVSNYFDTLDEMISDKRIDDIKTGKSEMFTLQDVAIQLGLK
ncbi:CopG family ribbon-helix-helix protein [Aliarcobacter cryaerophilus]|uniref:CopG family ribbon-helix-helix protein n=1 Tax=Aliarcobacter cryaerophilus TaxID=28198 RepID=UPI0021B53FD0|nr:ribbon-helix-helix domain-containing protein [Aliarcobacter cryaerophilus]MCT7482367.1 ribbon-helix-helix domain-containing protein [Aliarcobacter cryaerophilus]